VSLDSIEIELKERPPPPPFPPLARVIVAKLSRISGNWLANLGNYFRITHHKTKIKKIKKEMERNFMKFYFTEGWIRLSLLQKLV
jgi:hypothetical protein